jgi:hypothetical protein
MSSTPEPAASSPASGVVVPSSAPVSEEVVPDPNSPLHSMSARSAPLQVKLKRFGVSLVPLLVLAAGLWSGLASCPTRVATGIPCPGCGLTRATIALLTGHFAEALHWHPLVPFMLPLVGFIIVRSLLVGAGLISSSAWQVRMPTWLPVVLVALVIGVWLARLAGYLGGPSDPIDPRGSVIGRALTFLGLI